MSAAKTVMILDCEAAPAQAYIDARYNKHYVITIEELEYLSGEVQKLQELINKVWRETLGI